MTIDEAIAHFGNLYQVCLALNIRPQNMTRWKKQGYIPYLQQHRLAVITEGELLPDEIEPNQFRREPKPKKGKRESTRSAPNENSII